MKYLILDRDGVINQDSEHYIKCPDEWLPIPGSPEAIAKATQAGLTVAIATNQSGLARGLYDEATLTDIHAKMKTIVSDAGGHIDRIVYCPHGPNDGCDCRKPAPGMLKELLATYQAKPEDCIFVGDSFRDLQAGWAVGMESALVLTGNGQKTLSQNEAVLTEKAVVIRDNLEGIVEQLLSR